jgi:hypothetical protein
VNETGKKIMARKKSAFDRVKDHLLNKGSDVPPGSSLGNDVEMLVRRCNEVRSLGREFGGVELSPYMTSLLRVSTPAPSSTAVMNSQAAASV